MRLRKRKTTEHDPSVKAVRESSEALSEVQSLNKDVLAVSIAHKILRERNHFIEQLEPVMRRKP